MLSFSSLALRRSASLLFSEVDFKIHSGQKLGLTGANGCGKTSLFGLIRGDLSADQGEFTIPQDWIIAEVLQEAELSDRAAIEYVIDGDRELRLVEGRLAKAESEVSAYQIASCHERLQEIDGYQATSRAAKLLSGLGFSEAEITQPVKSFSGGWIMRLNLARALMCRSDLLLLDEPTNHLDLDAVIWLEQWLRRYEGTLLLISHDREFLDAVVNLIAHIEQQAITLYRGNYSAFEVQRAEKLAQQQSGYEKQQQTITHMQHFIDRFKAKATKARQAQSRIKALEKMQLISPAHIDSPFHFEFRAPKALPTSLIKLDRVSTGYGEKMILQNIDFSLIPGERIGLLGLNGAGKSTFIKLLAEELQPSAGEIVRSKDLKIGYFAQHQVEQLDLQATALLIMQRLDPSLNERQIRTYLGSFNFRADKVLNPVKSFSGGEKARLVLAILIWQRPNLLLLDEPTNHLDLEMRLALNQALQGFEGSVILVSHDRHLLRSVCDDLWLVDSAAVNQFKQDVDGYPAWLSARKSQAGFIPSENSTQKVNHKLVRRQLKAMQNQLGRMDDEISSLHESREILEQELSSSQLYDAENRDQLNITLAAQAANAQKIKQVEDAWLELSEKIEDSEGAIG
jgi:ATP-binding cassette subfamily F protein 3